MPGIARGRVSLILFSIRLVLVLVLYRQEGAARIDEQCARIRYFDILSADTEDLEAQGFF
jgi:hypothetical protein